MRAVCLINRLTVKDRLKHSVTDFATSLGHIFDEFTSESENS